MPTSRSALHERVATARILCRGLFQGHDVPNPRQEEHAVATTPFMMASNLRTIVEDGEHPYTNSRFLEYHNAP